MKKKKALLLKKNSDISEININPNIDVNNILYDDIKHLVTKVMFEKMEKQCNWEFDEYDIGIYGSKDGIAGEENKTELPIPEDTDLYFGDILVIRSKDNKIVDFNKKEWEEFYEISCGGFESLDSENTYDSETDTDLSDDEDYVENKIDYSDDTTSDSSETDNSIGLYVGDLDLKSENTESDLNSESDTESEETDSESE